MPKKSKSKKIRPFILGSGSESFTLGQIEDVLETPQHVLLHLCEKEVISPDFSDADGRGRFRKFSRANLVEFAIALEIRRFQIPVVATRLIILLLRSVEETVQKNFPTFTMLDMGQIDSIQLSVYIDGAERFIFSFHEEGKDPMRISCLLSSFMEKKPFRFVLIEELPENPISRLEINISKIIQELVEKNQ